MTYEKTKKAIFSKLERSVCQMAVILSTVLGIIAGTCFWIFISRCGNEECFLNYDPLPEMFIGGVIGAFLYVIIWGMTSDM